MSGEALRVMSFEHIEPSSIAPTLRIALEPPAAPEVVETDPAVLTRAFEDFTACADKLKDSFSSLKAEVRSLAAELEEKNRLIEALERQAARNERIAAMGEMAQRIAHQIRNPLGTIELYASMLSQDLAGHPSRALVERIGTAVRATDLVVDNLLAFADDMDPVRAPLCMHETLREAAEAAGRLVSARRVSVELQLEARETCVDADSDLVRQAVLNLVTNAAQAVPEGSAVTIATQNRRLGEDHESWLTVQVIDRGVGIEGADLERVFDPLYSTRRGAAGIGLAIVQRVAETHGGLIEVESAPGQGTTVHFSLPVHTPAA